MQDDGLNLELHELYKLERIDGGQEGGGEALLRMYTASREQMGNCQPLKIWHIVEANGPRQVVT